MELDKYLTTSFKFRDVDSSDFDILKWWKLEWNDFLVISVIAMDLLAWPASYVFTVAVKITFRALRQILDKWRRSNLSKENLKAQLCLSDWLGVEKRNQHFNLRCSKKTRIWIRLPRAQLKTAEEVMIKVNKI